MEPARRIGAEVVVDGEARRRPYALGLAFVHGRVGLLVAVQGLLAAVHDPRVGARCNDFIWLIRKLGDSTDGMCYLFIIIPQME